MEPRKCPACDKKLAGFENGPECDGCKNQPLLRCGDCGKKTQVQNGKEFCPRCEPLLCRLIQTDGGKRTIIHEGPDWEAGKRYLWETLEAEEYPRSKVTFTLWGETFYGPKLNAARVWVKVREVETQGTFKDVAGNFSENP
jgi:hypothetical protein